MMANQTRKRIWVILQTIWEGAKFATQVAIAIGLMLLVLTLNDGIPSIIGAINSASESVSDEINSSADAVATAIRNWRIFQSGPPL